MFRIVVINLNGTGQEPCFVQAEGFPAETEQEAYDTFTRAHNNNRNMRYSHLFMIENMETGSRNFITRANISFEGA